MQNFLIDNFSAGENSLYDPRLLAPNSSGAAAECVRCENLDISAKGAIVCSSGYEKVSSGAGLSGGTKNLLSYQKDHDTKYLLIGHSDDYYRITPADSTWTSIGDYGDVADDLGGIVYKGKGLIRKAILGCTGENQLTVWDGTSALSQVLASGLSCTMTIATPAVVTLTAHGLFAGDVIKFATTGALPTGVTAGQIYYVIAAGLTADAFQFSETSGGAAVNTSGTQSGQITLWKFFTLKNTCTMTIADPCVVTLVGHGLYADDMVRFTTTGNLPTGITAGTTYYVIEAGLETNTFQISTTKGGTPLVTSGAQAGVHSLWYYKPPFNSPIMETFMGRLFVAKEASLYYTDIEDETAWSKGGVVGFDDDITGIRVQGESLLVFTKYEGFAVQFYYNDTFSLSTPLKKPFKNSSGCLSHKSLVSVYNDTFYLSPDGIQKFGADPQFIATNLRVNSLSWKVNPSITNEAVNQAYINKACAIYFEKKIYFAVPNGDDPYNSKIWVYNYDYDAWTTRSGIYPSGMAVMSSTDELNELYFASCLSPDLYKFSKGRFDYDGAGYDRVYTSKIFTMGDPMRTKFWKYIDIRGSMYEITTFYVDVTVDGQTKTFKINSSNLEKSLLGGYYGDDYLGDTYFGGATQDKFVRYGARIPFPVDIAQGRELQITFRNSEPGQPWSVNYMNIVFDWEPTTVLPRAFMSATLT